MLTLREHHLICLHCIFHEWYNRYCNDCDWKQACKKSSFYEDKFSATKVEINEAVTLIKEISFVVDPDENNIKNRDNGGITADAYLRGS